MYKTNNHNNSTKCSSRSVQANDAYLQMAIGNAPWPIGVTMVGIHARTGREKIFSQSIAHVLNDETQRKYIQVTVGWGEGGRGKGGRGERWTV